MTETAKHYSTATGAEIDPWKENARLVRENEELRNTLHNALWKIEVYHNANEGRYQGGIPNQILLPQIRKLLGIKK